MKCVVSQKSSVYCLNSRVHDRIRKVLAGLVTIFKWAISPSLISVVFLLFLVAMWLSLPIRLLYLTPTIFSQRTNLSAAALMETKSPDTLVRHPGVVLTILCADRMSIATQRKSCAPNTVSYLNKNLNKSVRTNPSGSVHGHPVLYDCRCGSHFFMHSSLLYE